MDKFFFRAIYAFLFAVNVAAGIHEIRLHPGRTIFYFSSAGMVAAILFLMEWQRRKLERLQREFELKIMSNLEAEKIAKDHLEMVAKALRAEAIDGGYKIRIGDYWYVVSVTGMTKYSSEYRIICTTCLRKLYMMPNTEFIASVLLALHAKPELFDMWRQNQGVGYV